MAIEPESKRALTVRDALKTYSIGRTFFYRLVAQGRIKTVKIGSRRLVPVDQMEALISGGAND